MPCRAGVALVVALLPFSLAAQTGHSVPDPGALHLQWLSQSSGTKASLRGLSAVNDHVAWAGGTGGTFLRTIDGGQTWRADSIDGALDFRDVEAFDAQTAILMSAGTGELSRIYKTADGGKSWKLCHKNAIPEVFFDGMAFWDQQYGILFGDPVNGRLFVMTTSDGGNTWSRVAVENCPAVLPKEYAFAASGTSIAVQGTNHVWIATGGAAARVFRSVDKGRTWTVAATPLVSGNESSGIFSLAMLDTLHGVAVGGNYQSPDDSTANAAETVDGGKTWRLAKSSRPAGYRSCVASATSTLSTIFIAVGPNGSDFAVNTLEGLAWINFGDEGCHALSVSKRGHSIWAAGAGGRIARLNTNLVIEAGQTAK